MDSIDPLMDAWMGGWEHWRSLALEAATTTCPPLRVLTLPRYLLRHSMKVYLAGTQEQQKAMVVEMMLVAH